MLTHLSKQLRGVHTKRAFHCCCSCRSFAPRHSCRQRCCRGTSVVSVVDWRDKMQATASARGQWHNSSLEAAGNMSTKKSKKRE